MHKLLLLAGCCLVGACAPQGPGDAVDAGLDAGKDLPEWELRLSATIGGAARATVGDVSDTAPALGTKVTDVVTATYAATRSEGGASASTETVLTRQERGMSVAVQASCATPGGISAVGAAEIEIHTICLKARGARSYRITYSCDGTMTGTGEGVTAISANQGAIPVCNRSVDYFVSGNIDKPWDQQQKVWEHGEADIEGEDCWSGGPKIYFGCGGGAHAFSGSVDGTVTMTVEPIY